MNDWKPIDIAPKDGRWFAACDRGTAHTYRARWNGNEFVSEDYQISMKLNGWWTGHSPELWTELPDPPWMVRNMPSRPKRVP
jgi:hypothetical protein